MKINKRRILLLGYVFLSIIFIGLLVLFFVPDTISKNKAYALQGVGTEANPYIIDSQAALAEIRTLPSTQNAHFIQTADINLSGQWTPIGTQAAPFRGNYDGGGKKLNNLTITAGTQYAGLFGYVGNSTSNVTIKNIIFYNVNILYPYNSACYGGAVAGYVTGLVTIENIKVESGMVGLNSGTATGRFGGLIGHADSSTLVVENSYNKASVSTNFGAAGGIIGSIASSSANVLNCFNDAAISAQAANQSKGASAGGIIGAIESASGGTTSGQIKIENCFNINTVNPDFGSGKANAGGITGKNNLASGNNNKLEIIHCFNAGTITNVGLVGGLTTGSGNTIITESYHNIPGDSNYYSGDMTGQEFADLLGDGYIFNEGEYPTLAVFGPSPNIIIRFNYNYVSAPEEKLIRRQSGEYITESDIPKPVRTISNGVVQFLGWSDSSDGELIYEYDGENKISIEVTENLRGKTLFARWNIIEYVTVSFNYNYSGPQNTVIRQLPGYIISSADIPKPQTRTIANGRAVFIEWNTEQSGTGFSYTYNQDGSLSQNIVVTDNMTLYAIWENEPYISVVFKYNYDGAPQDRAFFRFSGDILTSDNIAMPQRRTTPNGVADFTGWNTEQNGTGDWYKYSQNGTLVQNIVITENMTLYAQWSEIHNVTVTFDYNYDNAPNDKIITKLPATDGGNITITALDVPFPSRTILNGVAVFTGWKDTESDILYIYDNLGDISIAVNEDAVLEAQWNVTYKVTVTFNYNYIGAPANAVITKFTALSGGSITITADDIAMPSERTESGGRKAFVKWTSESDGSGAEYAYGGGLNITVNEDAVLFAQWQITAVTVRFNYNYTGAPEEKVITRLINTSITEDDIEEPQTRTLDNGFALFSGWSYSVSGTPFFVYNNGELNIIAVEDLFGKTLFAIWENEGFATITFIYNYSSSPANKIFERAPGLYDFSGDMGEPLPRLKNYLVEYEFIEWNTQADGDGSTCRYINGELLITVAQEDIVLYAIWRQISEFSVTFNYNYTGAPADKIVTGLPGYTVTSSEISMPQRRTTPNGVADFTGWNTEQNGTGDWYTYNQNGTLVQNIVITEDITLYAQWSEIHNVTVTFKYGYDGAPADKIITKLPAVNEGPITITALDVPLPSRIISNGVAVFLGWKDIESNTLYTYDNLGGISIAVNEDAVLEAQWNVIYNVTVTFNYNDYQFEIDEIILVKLPGHIINVSDIPMPQLIYSGDFIEAKFIKWTVNADGSGAAYGYDNGKFVVYGTADEVDIQTLSGVTLYAQWTKFANVTFDYNYPALSLENKSINEPFGYIVAEPKPGDIVIGNFKEAEFVKWTVNEDGSGNAYGYYNGKFVAYGTTSELDIQLLNGLTLYAQWTVYVRITFNYNDNKTPVKTFTVIKNQQSLIELPVPKRLYEAVFLRWENSGGSVWYEYDVNEELYITATRNLTLYAKWNPIEYTIEKYNTINGTVSFQGKNPLTTNDIGNTNLVATAIAEDSYAFYRWEIRLNDSGTWILLHSFQESTINMVELFNREFIETYAVINGAAGTITLRAQFIEVDSLYSITIRSSQQSYGRVEINGQLMEYNKAFKFDESEFLNIAAIDNPYYNFVKFSSNKGSAFDVILNSGSAFTIDSDVIIIAEFIKESGYNISISYEYLSGDPILQTEDLASFSNNTQFYEDVKIGDEILITSPMNKPGYKFFRINGVVKDGINNYILRQESFSIDNTVMLYLKITKELLDNCLKDGEIKLKAIYLEQYEFFVDFSDSNTDAEIDIFVYDETEKSEENPDGRTGDLDSGVLHYLDKGTKIIVRITFNQERYRMDPLNQSGLEIGEDLIAGLDITLSGNSRRIIINLEEIVYGIKLQAKWEEEIIESVEFNEMEAVTVKYGEWTGIIESTGTSGYNLIGWYIKDQLSGQWVKLDEQYIEINNSLRRIPYSYLIDFVNGNNEIEIIARFVPVYSLTMKTSGSWPYTVEIDGNISPDLISGHFNHGSLIKITVEKSKYVEYTGFDMFTDSGSTYTFIVNLTEDLVFNLSTKLIEQSFNIINNSDAKGVFKTNEVEDIGSIITRLNGTIAFSFDIQSGYKVSEWTINGMSAKDMVKENYAFYSGNMLVLNLDERTMDWLNENGSEITVVIKTIFNPLYTAGIIGGSALILGLLIFITLYTIAAGKKKKQIKAAEAAGIIGAARFRSNLYEDALNAAEDKDKKSK